MYKHSTGDVILDWMYANLEPGEITLENYVGINWCGDKAIADLEAEELSVLPSRFNRRFLRFKPLS